MQIGYKNMVDNKIAVIGSGITGLTAAYSLKKNGCKVTLFEKNGEPGGAIKTVRNGEWLTEYGPNTLLIRDKRMIDLFLELGLNAEIIQANPDASKRFIVKNDELVPLPMSIMDAIRSPLFSLRGKLRLFKEPFLNANPNRDQSIAEFIERRLGKEILDYTINPFVAGIFANRPENLSLRHTFPQMDQLEERYGSLILGAIAGSRGLNRSEKVKRQLISFKNGIQTLPNRLASSLDQIHYQHKISSLANRGDKWFLVSNGEEFGPYENVIINVPLYQIGEILDSLINHHYVFNREVSYPKLSVLYLGYKKGDIQHPLDGFGFLVPEIENSPILGALFNSTLFEGRSPEDSHLLTVFVGGGREPKLADMETGELVRMVEKELEKLIGLRGSHQFIDHVYWPKSIPAYHIGYDEVLNSMDQFEYQFPGLRIAGNFRKGVSVPDCMINGLKLAETMTVR